MSERFEESIIQFYERERIANTQLLNLSEEPKVTNRDLANNLDFNLKHLILLSRVSLKNYHQIIQNQEVITKKLDNLELQVQELSKRSSLTKKTVQNIVTEVSKQPKEIEEQALNLISKLEEKLVRVEHLVEKLNNWVG
uniref:ORF1 protein n=1 Tax=Cacao swollen shoot Ghana R virus TaxID=2056886 RepID=A0A2H4U972_9VIRU|nr:ORF1 protein [Cacao swollen shoot Ghana R virus]